MKRRSSRLAPICVLLIVRSMSAFFVIGPPITVFTHQSITMTAAADPSATECVVSRLADFTAQVDFFENDATAHPIAGVYDGVHHFDRKPGQDHKAAFNAGLAYFQSVKFNAQSALQRGDKTLGLQQLGYALHSIQDLVSHSNLVDAFTDVEQNTILIAVLNGTAVAPALLARFQLMYYDPNSPDIHDNSGVDPYKYTHKDNAKDFSTSPYHSIAALKASLVSESLINSLHLGSSLCEDPPTTTITPVTSLDPNDKSGPRGIGVTRLLSIGQSLSYAIYFEDQPTATAPAQSVVVTDIVMNTLMDLNSLSLGPITVANRLITPPSISLISLGAYTTNLDLRPANNIILRVVVSLNTATGTLKWTFTSLDPFTGLPTTDPSAGFLPPGGEGSVSFNIAPKNPTTGTQITNKATIIFDVNAPIDTPVWLNTIDNTKPVSHVNALAATQSVLSFPVSWTGTDVGAGVQDFVVYVSDNGGVFAPWKTQTNTTQALFTGVAGHTYGFYSLARDQVGNVEAPKTIAEAFTQIVTASPKIVVTRTLMRDSQNNVVVNIMLANTGTSTSRSTLITAAMIGTTAAAVIPKNAVDIAAGASVAAEVAFPGSVGSPGATAVLTIGGTYVGGSFNFTSRIILP